MKERKTNTHLPKCVYLKNGAYWYVKRRKWVRICSKHENFESELALLAEEFARTPVEISTYIFSRLPRIKAAAKERNLEWAIDRNHIQEMLDKSMGQCSVTGLTFSLERIGNTRPYSPSIDRINSKKGYTPDNVRVVCVAANLAMNEWGEDVLRRMLTGMKAKGGFRRDRAAFDDSKNDPNESTAYNSDGNTSISPGSLQP